MTEPNDVREAYTGQKRGPQAGFAYCLSNSASKSLNADGDGLGMPEPNTEGAAGGEVLEGLPGSKSVAREAEAARNQGGPERSRRTNYERQAGRGVQRQEESPDASQGVGFVHSSQRQDASLEAGEGTDRLTKHAQATRCRTNDGTTLANLPASDTQRVNLKSPVRANRTPGSARGALGNWRPYLDTSFTRKNELTRNIIPMKKRNFLGVTRFIFAIALAIMLLPFSLAAQVNTGSDGHDGDFNPKTNVVINMADHSDGIYQYSSVNIPKGVTVTFIPNIKNTPVTWLIKGDCLIDGYIDVSGKTASLGVGAMGGPGGFAGGSGGTPVCTPGEGPGGGKIYPPGYSYGGNASYGALGEDLQNLMIAGSTYGNKFILPLIGGSGGAGYKRDNFLCGGGGGGGAFLIASPKNIVINGAIVAYGGYSRFGVITSDRYSGNGSGGAVRLITETLSGSGSISVQGPAGGGFGRIRLDALEYRHSFLLSGTFTQGFQPIIIPGASQDSQITIASIAGVPVPSSPQGIWTNPDVTIPAQAANPVTLVVNCRNIPLNTTITLFAMPVSGPTIQVSAVNNTGSFSASAVNLSINMPHGRGIIYAQATTDISTPKTSSFNENKENESYAITGLTTDGERFTKMELTAALGESAKISYVTKSGAKYSLPTTK